MTLNEAHISDFLGLGKLLVLISCHLTRWISLLYFEMNSGGNEKNVWKTMKWLWPCGCVLTTLIVPLTWLLLSPIISGAHRSSEKQGKMRLSFSPKLRPTLNLLLVINFLAYSSGWFIDFWFNMINITQYWKLKNKFIFLKMTRGKSVSGK